MPQKKMPELSGTPHCHNLLLLIVLFFPLLLLPLQLQPEPLVPWVAVDAGF
jgi:hypothetical protein